jgi:hypothetical protein
VLVSDIGVGLVGGDVGVSVGKIDALACFRAGLYGCMTGWANELFEPADAVLCLDGPV